MKSAVGRNRNRPLAEFLQPRLLLANTYALSSGIFTVNNDDLSHTINITRVSQGGAIQVFEDGNFVYSPSGTITGLRVYGKGGNDTLSIGSWVNLPTTLSGGDGNDRLTGSILGELLQGNAGNDTLDGAHANDSLDGGTGDDSLKGDIGNDLLFGGDGNDTLEGFDGNDSLSGDANYDSLIGGWGNDTINGGTGGDGISYNLQVGLRDLKVNISFDGVVNDLEILPNGTVYTDTLVGAYEYVVGSAGNDTLTGSDAIPELLFGMDGDDLLQGAGLGFNGDDLHGGNGNDTLLGGLGIDVFFGDAGNDSLVGGGGGSEFRGGTGSDTCVGSELVDWFVLDTQDGSVDYYYGNGGLDVGDGPVDLLDVLDNPDNDVVTDIELVI